MSSSSLNKPVGKGESKLLLGDSQNSTHEPARASGSRPAPLPGRLGWVTSASPFPPVPAWVDLPARERDALSGRYLAQLQVRQGAGVDEGLGYHRETGVDVVCLVDVEDELGVLQDVDPKPER